MANVGSRAIPATRKTYRLGDFEAWLLQQSDGQRNVANLLTAMKEEFGSSCPSPTEALQMLLQLQQSRLLSGLESLLASQALGSSYSIWSRAVSAVTMWRISGLNLDRQLGKAVSRTNWLFSSQSVAAWCVLSVLALLAVLFNFERLQEQGISWQWIVQPRNAGGLFLVFVATRALHELGHALVCKRFGVRCPDIGILFVLGTPCVYCDVSESWGLQERWKRAAIAAAGMYVELILSTVAVFVWCITLDGAANSIALHVMLVCSVSTVLVNANPLMRFDGYHILSDWLDEANLRQSADRIANRYTQGWILGKPNVAPVMADHLERSLPPQKMRDALMTGYSFACNAYRIFLACSIATILVLIYDAWYLEWIGRFLAVLILIGMCGAPSIRWGRQLMKNANSRMSQLRLFCFFAVLFVLLFLLPLPQRRSATGWVQPVRAQGVYTQSNARLVRCFVGDGESVETKQDLFLLKNASLEVQTLKRKQDADIALIRANQLKRERDMHGTDVDLAAAQTQLETAQILKASAEHELRNLQLRASMSGIFSAARLPENSQSGEETPQNGDTDFSQATQVGRSIPQGTLLGTIRSRATMVVIPLSNAQLVEVAKGSEVRVLLPSSLTPLVAEVQSIVDLENVEDYWLPSWSPAPSSIDFTPTSPRFAALAILPEDAGPLPGARVQTVIVTPSLTLAQLCKRWLQTNVNLLAE